MSREKSTALVPYDPNMVRGLSHSFKQALDVYECKDSIESKRIAAGDSPFAVWREERGLGKEAVAEYLGRDILDYTVIENDMHKAVAEDVIRFCEMLRIHPYDLVGNDALVPAIRDALIAVYDDPQLVLLGKKRAEDLSGQLLMDEASTAHRLLAAQEETLSSSYPEHHGLTIEFIRTLLKSDGSLDLGALDIFDYADMFATDAEDEKNDCEINYNRYTKAWKTHSKSCHIFGLYLFRNEWPKIMKKLDGLRRQSTSDNAINVYLTRPDFINKKSFPEMSSLLFIQGKSYSWQNAQRRHAEHLETLFLSHDLKTEMKSKIDRLDYQCNFFREWIYDNRDLLERFENRQEILRHHDFKHLVCRDPFPRTENGKMGLYSLFIKPYLK